MKNTKRKAVLIFVSVGITLTSAFSASAQKREMPYKEVDANYWASRPDIGQKPYRSTYTVEIFAAAGSVPTSKKVTVREEVPPGSSRTVTTEWSSGGKTEKREFIYVDGKPYRRTNDGPWDTTPTDFASLIAPPMVGSEPKTIQTKKQAWFIENVSINGRPVKVYETKSSSTYAEKNGRVTYIATNRYWIRDDGLLLKTSSENTVLGKPGIIKGVTEYEYDNVTITAPIR